MADVTVKVLTPATNFDLLTLEEAKLLLGIAASDVSQDLLLAMHISAYSVAVSQLCNRIFAKEKVTEIWREHQGRIYLTHWPVKEIDVEKVATGNVTLFADEYEIEEASGKVSNVANGTGPSSLDWAAPATITYTGGFDLPDEAPLPLKQATALLIRGERQHAQQSTVSGIRMIAHKEKRVMFYDPNAAAAKQVSATSSPSFVAAKALLGSYMRIWI